MRTRVKICGLTRVQDVQAAVQAGADALGLVFYPESARYVSLELAAELSNHIPAFVSTVCLFVNPSAEQVNEVISLVQPDLLQFHADESPSFCASFSRPYIKALRVGAPGLTTGAQLHRAAQDYSSSRAVLLDAYTPAYGGTGTSFDGAILDDLLNYQTTGKNSAYILAGGMRVENVRERVARWRPYAIDVSSGVEESPGLKSAGKMHQFIQAIRHEDESR